MPRYAKPTQPSVFAESAPDIDAGILAEKAQAEKNPPLRAKFQVPPFSVLSVQSHYWRKLNEEWVREIGLPPVVSWGYDTEMPMLDITLDDRPEGPLPLSPGTVGGLFSLTQQARRAMRESAPEIKPFLVPPFSILSARGGHWQEFKRYWINGIGLHGERGRSEIETTDGNVDRVLGVGLSEGQARINKTLEKFAEQKRKHDATPGGGPNSVRRRAPKDLGNLFDPEAPKQSGDFIGAKVRDFDYYRRIEGRRRPCPSQKLS